VLRDIQRPELLGEAHQLYQETVDRLVAPGIATPQAILATLHVLTVAEATSNSVRGPFSVAIIRENGIWMDDPPFIADMVSRLRDIETWTNHILLACSDTSISPAKLGELLSEFGARAVALHQAQIQRVAQLQVNKGLFIINDSYARLPPGAVLSISESGPVSVQCDTPWPDWYRAGVAKIRKLEEQKKVDNPTPSDAQTSESAEHGS
jgi:hypothetical protein